MVTMLLVAKGILGHKLLECGKLFWIRIVMQFPCCYTLLGTNLQRQKKQIDLCICTIKLVICSTFICLPDWYKRKAGAKKQKNREVFWYMGMFSNLSALEL